MLNSIRTEFGIKIRVVVVGSFMCCSRSLGVKVIALVLFVFFPFSLFADTNPIEQSKLVSAQASGLIKKFRLNIDDSAGFGNDSFNAELFVTLDNKPDQEYTVQIRQDSEISADVITETLRYAYMHRLPVTIFHVMPLETSDQFKILMVQIRGGSQPRSTLRTAKK